MVPQVDVLAHAMGFCQEAGVLKWTDIFSAAMKPHQTSKSFWRQPFPMYRQFGIYFVAQALMVREPSGAPLCLMLLVACMTTNKVAI